jgi:hypothetical protein
MNEAPADWYVATLLDACADQLEAINDHPDVAASVARRNLIVRCREASAALQALA